jgi:hypothetical protein
VLIYFFDYDLTENFAIQSVAPITASYPNFAQNSATPYPSPIPDPSDTNQQNNPSQLNYPNVSMIPQINQTMVNGHYPLPSTSGIRPFLYIENISGNNYLSIEDILTTINNIIYKNGIPPTDDNNYFSSLNPNYYYNLPNITPQTPLRNICIWTETDINYIYGKSWKRIYF